MKNKYLIKIRTTDSRGLFYEAKFYILVNDLPETIIILNNTEIKENSPINTLVGYLTIQSPFLDREQYTNLLFVSGEGDKDNDKFYI